MDILFLQLSDIHIEDKNSISYFHLKKIIHAVRAQKPFDFLFLVLSGDIAYSGQEHQYDVAYKMVGRIINLLKTECDFYSKVHIILVPGNHDVDMSGSPLTSKELMDMRKKNSFTWYMNTELEKQRHFFNFANRNKLFTYNKLFEHYTVQLTNDFSIEINLINSALFSTLEEDKGLHFLPQDVIQSVNNPTEADFVITVMHHPSDWFIDTTMQPLENVIYSKSSLVFYGHEHFQATSMIINEQSKGALIHAGGCLSEKNRWDNSQFIIGKLSIIEKKYVYIVSKYKWNFTQNQYERMQESKHYLPDKPSRERNLIIISDYKEKLLVDTKQEAFKDFTRYFVFPRMETMELPMSHTREFITDDEFIEEVLTKKKVMINGQYNTGKTTLLKWLFMRLIEKGYTPILCDSENIQGNPKRIIKNCFEDIYGDNASDFQRFEQISKDKKIFLIDDVDLIKPDHFEKLISGVCEEFSYFIFASKHTHNLDMIERMKTYLKTADSIHKYQLTMFYSDKRNQLIQKAVECHLNDQFAIEKVTQQVSELIKAQKRLIRFDPDFILKYVAYYCKNVGDTTTRTTNIFSKVFEASIINSLNRYGARISVEKAFMLLSAIAYDVHFGKIYPIPGDVIKNSIDNYNKEYGANVPFEEAFSLFIEAKIIIPNEGEIDGPRTYRFANKSYLAFFVARRLNVQYHETGDDGDLQYIIKNACFGINADILLFITYITDNVRILRFILDMVDSYTKDWVEFSLNNLPNFLKWRKNHRVDSPSPDAFEQHEKNVINEEKQVQNGIETVDLYDYSDEEADKEFNCILRAIQLLSIVARCLPIFEHIMKKPEKDRFVKQIYELPNKIFRVWSNWVDKEAEEFIRYFEQQPDHYYVKQRAMTTQDIVQALQWTAMSFLLDLYKMSMDQATKEHTLNYFEEYPQMETQNELYKLQYLIALEVQGTGNSFVTTAIQLSESTKEPLIQTMVARVVTTASVFKKMHFKDNQRLQEAFFKGTQSRSLRRPQMLLMQRQKRRDE